MNRRYALGLIGAAAVTAGAFSLAPRSSGLADFGAAYAAGDDVDTSAIREMVMGAEDAPVTLMEYASFTCPHCAEFHATVYPKLKKNYIDTGKIKFTFRAFFFNRYGLWADMVARCGGEMRFFGIADMLYDQQTDWVGAGSADKVIAKLKTIGRSAGLTDGQMDQCL